MKRLVYIMGIGALGVVLSAAAKVLWGSSFSSWGIAICSLVFIASLVLFLFSLVRRGERVK
jgi:hypothetical protein